jgi:hypothetical protein
MTYAINNKNYGQQSDYFLPRQEMNGILPNLSSGTKKAMTMGVTSLVAWGVANQYLGKEYVTPALLLSTAVGPIIAEILEEYNNAPNPDQLGGFFKKIGKGLKKLIEGTLENQGIQIIGRGIKKYGFGSDDKLFKKTDGDLDVKDIFIDTAVGGAAVGTFVVGGPAAFGAAYGLARTIQSTTQKSNFNINDLFNNINNTQPPTDLRNNNNPAPTTASVNPWAIGGLALLAGGILLMKPIDNTKKPTKKAA